MGGGGWRQGPGTRAGGAAAGDAHLVTSSLAPDLKNNPTLTVRANPPATAQRPIYIPLRNFTSPSVDPPYPRKGCPALRLGVDRGSGSVSVAVYWGGGGGGKEMLGRRCCRSPPFPPLLRQPRHPAHPRPTQTLHPPQHPRELLGNVRSHSASARGGPRERERQRGDVLYWGGGGTEMLGELSWCWGGGFL